MPNYRAAIVTVSDSVAQGTRENISGPTVGRILEDAGWTVKSSEVVPDDFNLLRERLSALASEGDADAVFTTGGTGIGPRDRTPEATTSVMERAVAGLAELMRREGMKKTPLAALSRGVVGIKGKTLIVNLPGAPDGAGDSVRALLPVLPHALDVLRGEEAHAPAGAAPAGEGKPAEQETASASPATPPSPAVEESEISSSEPDSGSETGSAEQQDELGKSGPL